MKVEFDGLKAGFWVRNALRALLAWLWFDQGRYVARWAGDHPVTGIEIIIIISIVIVFAIELSVHSGGDDNHGE